jgi:hypothetical protein
VSAADTAAEQQIFDSKTSFSHNKTPGMQITAHEFFVNLAHVFV